MLTFSDLAEWAGPEGVVQASPEIAAKWAISASEKRALIEVGLPRFVHPFFEAQVQSDVEPKISSAATGQLYQVGWDMGRELGVASEKRGVYAVDPESELPDVLVNSSVVDLVEFLHHVGRERLEYPRMDEDEIDASLARIKAKLMTLDARAFASPDNWWSQVFEQMETGMY